MLPVTLLMPPTSARPERCDVSLIESTPTSRPFWLLFLPQRNESRMPSTSGLLGMLVPGSPSWKAVPALAPSASRIRQTDRIHRFIALSSLNGYGDVEG